MFILHIILSGQCVFIFCKLKSSGENCFWVNEMTKDSIDSSREPVNSAAHHWHQECCGHSRHLMDSIFPFLSGFSLAANRPYPKTMGDVMNNPLHPRWVSLHLPLQYRHSILCAISPGGFINASLQGLETPWSLWQGGVAMVWRWRWYDADRAGELKKSGWREIDIQWMGINRGRKLSAKELMLSNCGPGKDSWESLRLQDQTSQS